ncbi:hypothetical protein [Sphingopyxis yananensis]|nr:hypothetical protein [Sphingopyxis yananensis]
MSDVQTKIGKYNPETRTVSVTFTSGAIVHRRPRGRCGKWRGA